MAFGAVLGTDSVNSSSPGTSLPTTTGVAVKLGNLAVVCLAIRSTIATIGTSSIVDNLGNKWTLIQAVDGGATAYQASWYSVISKEGLMTVTPSWQNTTTGDAATIVGVFEGPYNQATPLDKNPANLNDATTPYDCPSSGTLSQAAELIIALGNNGNGQTYVATSPNVLVDQDGTGTGANSQTGVIGAWVVASTSAVAPQFTAAGSTNGNFGTATFRQGTIDDPNPRHRGRTAAVLATIATMAAPSVWPYVFPHGSHQPYGPASGIAAVIAPVADQPTFAREALDQGMDQIIRSWQPADWRQQQRIFTPQVAAAVATDNAPGVGVPKIVTVDDPPLPQITRKLVQGAAAAPDAAPGTNHQWLGPILRAWQPDAPSVQYRAKIVQEAAPPATDSPPPASRAWLNEVLDIWQPPDISQQLRRYVPIPDAVVVTPDNPPGVGVPKIIEAPDPLPPQVTRKLVQPFVADSAPGNGRQWLNAVLEAWQPDPPLPQRLRQTAAIIPTAVTPDNPPIGGRRFLGWTWGDATITTLTGGNLIPPPDSAPGAYRYWMDAVIQAWQPAIPLPQQRPPKIIPEAPTPPVTPDDPPGVGVPRIVVVDDAPIQLPRARLVQSAVVTIDDPPGLSREWLYPVLQSWQVTLPPQQAQHKLVQGIDAPSGLSREWLDVVLRSWQPPPPLPEAPAKLVQGIDAAPGQYRYWLDTVLRAWIPVPTQPQLPSKLIQPSTAEVIDNPPFSHRGRLPTTIAVVYQAWLPPPPQPQRHVPAVTTSATINNPIPSHPGRRATTMTAIWSWQPPPPQPQVKPPYVTESAPPAPVSEYPQSPTPFGAFHNFGRLGSS